ncbi:putative bifunctional diguanylate cyclase/phosphodiesterase [Nakamurella aerolata]
MKHDRAGRADVPQPDAEPKIPKQPAAKRRMVKPPATEPPDAERPDQRQPDAEQPAPQQPEPHQPEPHQPETHQPETPKPRRKRASSGTSAPSGFAGTAGIPTAPDTQGSPDTESTAGTSGTASTSGTADTEATDQRMAQVLQLIVDLATGRLDARLEPSHAHDELDAVITGINMLAEELQEVYGDLESRVAERTQMLRQAQSELERLALRDPLTGLANRSLVGDRIAQALAWGERGARFPAVLLLDLDGFKTINDSLGHTAGDAVLVEVARRLSTVARPMDTVARLGGDEFALVIPDTTAEQAEEVAAAALESLKEPLLVHGRSVWALASIGIRVGAAGETTDMLLRDADTAMYEAKTSGRGRAMVYQESMHSMVQRRLRVVSELGSAIRSSELRLVYQPIVDLASGRTVAVEALVRWHHPHRGLIMPDDFIPVAEDSGLVVDLGYWVAEAAIKQVSEWQSLLDDDDFRVYLNVSPVELRRPGLSEYLRDNLERFGVPTNRLALEISETALMSQDVAGLLALKGIEELGVSLEIDDFGTGYSSIAYLRQLPVDTVKVDRSLITEVTDDPRQRVFVGAVLQLIHSVGCRAVVEGVEEREQAEVLFDLGCERAQGFYFGRPMSPEAMTSRLALQARLARGPDGGR